MVRMRKITHLDKKRLSPEEFYEVLGHALPVNRVILPRKFVERKSPYFGLFRYIYRKVKLFYKHLPARKNGQNPFLHPINVLYALQHARVTDELTFCVALLHDYVEEMVDIYQCKKKINARSPRGKKLLDAYELKVQAALEKELEACCLQEGLPPRTVDEILVPVSLLTRHKRHYYYSSISEIFNFKKNVLWRERAVQVKLADRTHNIMSLEGFDNQGKLYQCFKNLFILNSTKKFLLDQYGEKVFTHKVFSATEKLFNKCAKATYAAFLEICRDCSSTGIGEVNYLLQLAFKKFKIQRDGIVGVTSFDPKETHPIRLFQGVVWKYDARLHQEWEQFERLKKDEFVYVKKFFKTLHFSKGQLQAILDYKDAYGLKVIVAQLIYDPGYHIEGFLSSQLSKKGRIRKRR